MKQYFLITGSLLGIALLVVAVLAWPRLQGTLPAVLPAGENIADLIKQAEEAGSASQAIDGENTAAFPLNVPDNFRLGVFVGGMEKPRVMAFAPDGWLLVSDTDAGAVYAVQDADGNGKAENMKTVIEGLRQPHGIAFGYGAIHDGNDLYIAETHRVARYEYDLQNQSATFAEHIMDLPEGGRHYTRTIMFHPDDPAKLLVSVGSSCDVCYEEDERRAAILQVDVRTKEWEVFASGLRNAVYMAVHPVTGDIWVTEMGRDGLGDDIPPDEINIVEKGKDYGWPICYGNNIHDGAFDKNQYFRDPCADKIPSQIDLQAHSAPLGLGFISEEGWPQNMWYDAIIAYHGSWNQTEPTGYKLMRLKLDANGNEEGREDFITGWLKDNGSALGRPAGILIQPGGVMYVTDDKAGLIYRITYQDDGAALITNFKECVAAGNPVMESYPRQCRAAGETFVEDIDKPDPAQPPKSGSRAPINDGCIVTGCSSQVCADEEVNTTCELRPEYQCYGYSACERQAGGECGWTQTVELMECLNNISRSE